MKKLMPLTLAALLVVSSLALADPGQHGQARCDHGRGGHGPTAPGHGCCMGMQDHKPGVKMILALADEITLTDDQKAKLEKMMVEFKLAKVDQRARVEKAEIRLRALKHDENASENEVMAAIDEVARMKADLHKMRYRHRKEVRNLLTDDQIDKLKELRKERMEKCKGPRPGPHHEMGPGGAGMGFGFAPDFDD